MGWKSYHQIGCAELNDSINGLINNKGIKKVAIRAVFTKEGSGDWKYLIGKCEFTEIEEEIEAIYSDCAFICKSLTDFDLKTFIESLEGNGFNISPNMPPIIKADKSNIFWSNDFIPSHATKSGYPERKFSAKMNGSYFDETILLGFGMPFYSSSGNFLKDFMGMRQYHGHSDGRNGEFYIQIPDQRAKICFDNQKISIQSNDTDVCLVGQTPKQDKLIMKLGETLEIDTRDFIESELWLLTKKNEVLDFRSQIEWQYRMETSDDEKRSNQILAIIDQGEGHNSEFKTYIELTKNKNSKVADIEKTVCALSNSQGGDLFIGVADDGCIKGVDEKVKKHYQINFDVAIVSYIKDIQKRLREILKNNQCFDICPVKIGTKHVVVISVTRSAELNYFVNTREAYIRRGATSFKIISADEREKTNESLYSLQG